MIQFISLFLLNELCFWFIDVLKDFFSRFGELTSANVMVDRETNRPRGKKREEERKFKFKYLFMFHSLLLLVLFICLFIFVVQTTYLFASFLFNYNDLFVHIHLFVPLPPKVDTLQAITLFYSFFLQYYIYIQLWLVFIY